MSVQRIFWTLIHPELAFEADVQQLLKADTELAKLLLVDKESGRLEMRVRLFGELGELRELHERRDLERAKDELEIQLRQKDELLTEVRHIEHELALKDQRLQMALMASGVVGRWDWRVDTDLLYGDANFARLYGLDESQAAAGLTMEQYQQFVVADDLHPLQTAIKAVFERSEGFAFEYRVAASGQPLRWVECKGRMIAGLDGKAPPRRLHKGRYVW